MTVLMLASTGGHLTELVRLRPRLVDVKDRRVVWVTFDTPQSRALLRGEDVIYVRYTRPRDLASVLVNGVAARRILREVKPTTLVSTGSAIALSFLPLASGGTDCHYIECSARGDGPSMTGRLLQRDPRVRLYSQYSSWAGDRWSYQGSVFDSWAPAAKHAPAPIERLVVSVGTQTYSFRRLFDRLVDIIPSGVEVLWQTGHTDVTGLPITGRGMVSPPELEAAIARADLVVSHAGIGSSMDVLDAGRCPLFVPRERRYGEHVDDHQREIAADLSGRGLAIGRSVSELTWEDLLAASALRARRVEPPPFHFSY